MTGVCATEVGPRRIARDRRARSGDDDGCHRKLVEWASLGEQRQVVVPRPRRRCPGSGANH
jgi:hypothetical protein